MKQIAIILITLLAGVQLQSVQVNQGQTRSQAGLKGKVKIVETTTTDYYSNYQSGVFRQTYVEDGHLKQQIYLRATLEKPDGIIYTYDSLGRLLSQRADRFRYADSAGRTIVFRSNAEGKLYSKTLYDLNGRPLFKFIYPNGNKVVYKYNNEGDLTAEILYAADGRKVRQFNHRYDNDHRKIRDFEFLPTGRKSSINYSYNSSGELISKIDSNINITKGRYNPKGKRSGEMIYYSYKYSNYDPQGNWLHMEMKTDGKLMESRDRRIEYW